MQKKSVIYEIYPKSFQDSNGDGIGDLQGIIKRLDYLKDLGVDYLWITPFCVSPQNDNGYDVANYYEIDPLFGTMADFEELVQEAQARDLNIIMDMVFNHTSTQHEWFIDAINGDTNKQQYYFFKDGTAQNLPNNWQSKFGGPAWQYVPTLKKWYLHLFDQTQADLNWANPDVRQELSNIVTFWMDKGVTGFRFDVINLISKTTFEDDDLGDGRRFYTDQSLVHPYLKELRNNSFGQINNSISIGELSSTSIQQAARYTKNQDELDLVFTFHHLKVDYVNNQKWTYETFQPQRLIKVLQEWQEGMQEQKGWLANFLNNHDQPRSVSRFGSEKYHYASATALAMLTFCLQGTPVLYQGEEIGMTNNNFQQKDLIDIESINHLKILEEQGYDADTIMKIVNSKSRDNARTPMQWDHTINAGFSNVKPWMSLNPNYEAINVAKQSQQKKSILNFYKTLIKFWKSCDTLQDGKIEFINFHQDVLAFYRIASDKLLIFINLSDQEIDLSAYQDYKILLSNYKLHETNVLKPYEGIILK